MPGLSIIHDTSGAAPRLDAAIERLGLVRHFPDYRTEILFRSPRVLVAATRYPEYPLATFRAGDRLVCIEGRLYGAPASGLERLAAAVAEHVRAGPSGVPALQRLIPTLDGDLLAVVVDPAEETAVVITDRFGRLPVYHAARDGVAVVSRELRYAAATLPGARLSRRVAAQYLAFGYPLGAGTLVEGVERMPPASMLHVPSGAVLTLLVHDFDRSDPPPVPAGEVPAYVADRVIAACRARAASGQRCLVSLSGGIDSRVVAGALRRAGIEAIAASHRDGDAGSEEDARIAGLVAARLGTPWEAIDVAPTGADVARLLRLKGGANNLAMSRMVPYLDELLARHGRDTVFFTGDQGDRLLGNRRPAVRLHDDDELAAYIVRRENLILPGLVGRLCGIGEDELLHAVHERLRTYPEREAVNRLNHFLFAERALRFVGEGEDRNRCWFWHASPFWAPDVFDAGMSIPPAAKVHDRMRAAVLRAVAPEVADLPTARGGGEPGSVRYWLRRRLEAEARSMMLRTLGAERERRLRALGRREAADGAASPALVRCVRRQLPAAEAALDRDAVERALAERALLPRQHLPLVLTVTAMGELLGGGASTLEEFRAERFA